MKPWRFEHPDFRCYIVPCTFTHHLFPYTSSPDVTTFYYNVQLHIKLRKQFTIKGKLFLQRNNIQLIDCIVCAIYIFRFVLRCRKGSGRVARKQGLQNGLAKIKQTNEERNRKGKREMWKERKKMEQNGDAHPLAIIFQRGESRVPRNLRRSNYARFQRSSLCLRTFHFPFYRYPRCNFFCYSPFLCFGWCLFSFFRLALLYTDGVYGMSTVWFSKETVEVTLGTVHCVYCSSKR